MGVPLVALIVPFLQVWAGCLHILLQQCIVLLTQLWLQRIWYLSWFVQLWGLCCYQRVNLPTQVCIYTQTFWMGQSLMMSNTRSYCTQRLEGTHWAHLNTLKNKPPKFGSPKLLCSHWDSHSLHFSSYSLELAIAHHVLWREQKCWLRQYMRSLMLVTQQPRQSFLGCIRMLAHFTRTFGLDTGEIPGSEEDNVMVFLSTLNCFAHSVVATSSKTM